MVHNTPPSLFQPCPGGREEGEEERKRREGRRRGRRDEDEEETYVLQLAVIRLCKFAVIRENLLIFAVIKKNVAAITPLGDFDMRPSTAFSIRYGSLMIGGGGLRQRTIFYPGPQVVHWGISEKIISISDFEYSRFSEFHRPPAVNNDHSLMSPQMINR